MTVRIAILVEGATEAAFKKALIAWLQPRLSGKMPKLDFLPEDGRIPKGEKLQRKVRLLLRTNDAVIALTDVYTGTNPPDFNDAADARAKMAAWVGPEPCFHPHAAQHEFEAWLLPYWPRVQALAKSKNPGPAQAPEDVNHGSLRPGISRTSSGPAPRDAAIRKPVMAWPSSPVRIYRWQRRHARNSCVSSTPS